MNTKKQALPIAVFRHATGNSRFLCLIPSVLISTAHINEDTWTQGTEKKNAVWEQKP